MIVHLVDGTYELFRHFFGLRRFTKGADPPLGAVLGVLRTVLQMVETGATHIGVATDHVIESFRNDLWPGYKTGAGIDHVLRAQFEPLEEALAAMGVRSRVRPLAASCTTRSGQRPAPSTRSGPRGWTRACGRVSPDGASSARTSTRRTPSMMASYMSHRSDWFTSRTSTVVSFLSPLNTVRTSAKFPSRCSERKTMFVVVYIFTLEATASRNT